MFKPKDTDRGVFARGTLEEAMIRHGGNLQYLQGKSTASVTSSTIVSFVCASFRSCSFIPYNCSEFTRTFSTSNICIQSPEGENALGLSQSPSPFEETKRVGVGLGKGKV